MNQEERTKIAFQFEESTLAGKAELLCLRKGCLTVSVGGSAIEARFTEEVNAGVSVPKKGKRNVPRPVHVMVLPIKDGLAQLLIAAGFYVTVAAEVVEAAAE